jgi:hypothetical protein
VVNYFKKIKMSAKTVHLDPTNNTPEVHLNSDGNIKISGRAIDESRAKYSEPILVWIDDYLLNPAKITVVTVALEYLNSYNSIILASIFKKLAQVNQQSKKLIIKWHIEEDDDDMLERGQYISSSLHIPIEFIMTDQIRSFF